MNAFDWNEETELLIKKALELGLIVSCEDHGYAFDCTFINASKHWDVEFYTNDSPKQIFFDTFSDASLSYFLHGLIIGHYHGRDTIIDTRNENIQLKSRLDELRNAHQLLVEKLTGGDHSCQ